MSKRKELELYQKIERSIITKYRKTLWHPFIDAVAKYQLINEGDKICVCISGGKDSFCMAKLIQELHAHGNVHFDVVYLVMDPGYNEINRAKIERNAALLHVPVEIFTSNIFDVANSQDRSPCYLCAKMRRGWLYNKAKELGCNKIALGHHFNDVIETTVMSMFYSSQIRGMMPKLYSDNFEGMELIRPMYKVHEDAIISWKNYNDLEFIQCACRFTENCSTLKSGKSISKRQEIKQLIKRLKQDTPDLDQSIFNAIHSIQLDTLPGWTYRGEDHSFLEHYDL